MGILSDRKEKSYTNDNFLVDRDRADPVASNTLTPIEAYFFLGPIRGPGRGCHIIELLRLVVLDIHAVNRIAGDPIIAYASHIARTIWNFGRHRYDCTIGSAVFVTQGGSFNLKRFLGEESLMCNCYDLAGIIQVCCAALGNMPDLSTDSLVSISCLRYCMSSDRGSFIILCSLRLTRLYSL